jgi:hypothetical protein
MFDPLPGVVNPKPVLYPLGVLWWFEVPPPGWRVVGEQPVSYAMADGTVVNQTLYIIEPEGAERN